MGRAEEGSATGDVGNIHVDISPSPSACAGGGVGGAGRVDEAAAIEMLELTVLMSQQKCSHVQVEEESAERVEQKDVPGCYPRTRV